LNSSSKRGRASQEKAVWKKNSTDEQQKLDKFKSDLMKATNEREYSTAVREIDVAKKGHQRAGNRRAEADGADRKLDAQLPNVTRNR
jgi:hypothetical protein